MEFTERFKFRSELYHPRVLELGAKLAEDDPTGCHWPLGGVFRTGDGTRISFCAKRWGHEGLHLPSSELEKLRERKAQNKRDERLRNDRNSRESGNA